MSITSLRYVRSLLLVSLVLSLSSASHVLAAGHLPHVGVIALTGALLLVPMMLITRRTLTFRAALAVMGTGQYLLHTLFGMTAAPAVCQSSSVMPGHHAAFELACAPAAPSQMSGETGGFVMVLLHGIATVILALAVSRCDAAVALLRVWLAPLLGVLPAVTLPAPRARTLVSAATTTFPVRPAHSRIPSLRGPPSFPVQPA